MKIDIRIKYKKALDGMKRLQKNLNSSMIKANKSTAQKGVEVARQFAAPHTNTGKMMNAIIALPVNKGKEYRIISKTPTGQTDKRGNVPYNIFQNDGYTNHINGVKYPGLHFMEDAFRVLQDIYPNKIKHSVDEAIKKSKR